MKKILFVHILVLMTICGTYAQVISPMQVQQIKVDDLTDDQVRQIVEEMKKNRVGLNEISTIAQQKGIPSTEVSKLKNRITALNLEKELRYKNVSSAEQVTADRSMNDENTVKMEDAGALTERGIARSRVFGSELFSNKNLTFEPNLRMPTPPNYRLAAGDELMIDVYGYSEVQHTLKVSPEGYIRIPLLGPVYVSGLTMEEAKTRISKQLSTIYSGINSGKTFVQVSLGNIRSIQILLIGEIMRPGTYTLTSLSTVANALYVSGGPNNNGSFRKIQVIRNGSIITTFDLYDFLRSGDLTNNIVLQDQDIVKINPYDKRVELTGEVKRPAIFEVKADETLKDVIDLAGGYTDIAYKDIIRAYRINNKERAVVNVNAAEVPNFQLSSGDKFFIDAILNRFSNRVMISGSVFHPGEYALEKNMYVSDLIKKADGVREEAFQGRALVFRLSEDLTPLTLSFDVQDVLSGRSQLPLIREDSVVIYSKFGLREPYQLKIGGEVNNPGYFNYYDSLKIEDLILMAGGFRDAASMKKIEIARRIRDKEFNPQDSTTTIIAYFNVEKDLGDAADFVLQPFDEVTVRKAPAYQTQVNTTINGEVLYPGGYSINNKKEKISDLLNRAGGLMNTAYLEGAVLRRKTFINKTDSILLSNKLQLYINKLKDSSDISNIQYAASQQHQLLGINLPEILRKPGSKYDLYLEEGDEIFIPKKLQTIQLFGEIYFPKKVRFDKSIRFRDYVRSAGGFTKSALKRRSYIVYANGDVKATRRILFFNSYPKVKAGAEIYIPKKGDHRGMNTQEIIGLSTGIASLALIIVTILNK
ncbi:SLBB domain-containing protein [Chitinophaga sp. NPDC101104]|uniref:SLBB domain-containing protein n=1 Tax=Chitinophaga sp. NPDC101104 TaxID=3390561 RepID=UPI003D08A663